MTKRCIHLRSRFTKKSKGIFSVLLLSVLTLCVGTVFAGDEITINNPYDGVSWEDNHRHKANFHTHTTNSDGKIKPHAVVDAYKALGYSALAITDHGRVTYPWTEFSKIEPHGAKGDPKLRVGYEDRDPEKVGMTSIKGNELSKTHHMVNLWSEVGQGRRDHGVSQAIVGSGKKGGQMIFAHPGRWGWHKERKRPDPNAWSVKKYAELFKEHNNIVGLEVYNAGDLYPQDRRMWDELLKVLMPDRPAWGFSNDDMHREEQIGRNWTVLLVKEPTEEQIKDALAKGQFFFVYCPKGHDGAKPPTIEKISVDTEKLVISVQVDQANTIQWISDGKVVGTGPTLELTKVEELGNYVRAMIYGTEDETVVGIQPFGIVRKK